MHYTLKTIKIFLIFFVLLMLYGCEETVDGTEDSVPTTYLYTHELTKENFESFFDVSYEINDDQSGSYTIDFDVEPKYVFITDTIHVTFTVDVMEVYGSYEEERPYALTISNLTTLNHLFESSDTDGLTEAYISGFDLSLNALSLQTDDVIEITLTSYPLTFQRPTPPPKFDILDPEQNQLNYNGLSNIFNSLDQIDPSHVSFELKESLYIQSMYPPQSLSSSTKLEVMTEPFYMMIESEGMKEVITATPEGDAYMLFGLSEYIKQGDDYLVRPIPVSEEDMMIYYSLIMMADPNMIINDYMFDASKMLIEEVPNGYRITAMLKDMLEEDAYQELVVLYDEMGVDSDILEDTVIKFLVLNLNDLYHFVVELTIVVNEPYKQTITSRNEYIYDFSEIEPITLNQDNIILLPALSPDDVILETNPLELVSVHERPLPHYFKVYLEEGQYVMYKSSTEIDISILDETLEHIDDKGMFKQATTGIYQHTFFIEADGYYYFEVDTVYHDGPYQFKVDKLAYISNLNEPETLLLGDNTLSITDTYDIKYVVFDAPKDMILSISGDAIDLNVIKELSFLPGTYQIGVLFEFGFDAIYWKVKEGLNEFYIVSEDAVTFTLHLSDYGDLSYQSSDIEEMTHVSEDFLEVPMLVGEDIGPSYVRLDAVKGVYTFIIDTGKAFLHPVIRLYEAGTDTFVDYIYTDVARPMVLEEGIYYLKVEASNNYLVNLKYEFIPYDNQVTDEVIGSYPTYDINGEGFPYFEGVFMDSNHRPVHRFTLTEEKAVVISTSPRHLLYDEDGKLLTFSHLNLSHSRVIYFLEAGTYDLKPFTTNTNDVLMPYQIKVGVVDGEIVQDNYYPREKASFLYEGGSIQFTDNHSFDYEVIEIVITERVSYRLSGNKQFYLYDEALNQIENFMSNSSKLVTFEPGTYYLVTHRFPIGDFRLTIWPPEYEN